MRVITDNRFNQIYNACYNPAQGQVEDYSVRIINPASAWQPKTAPEVLVFPNPSNGDFTVRGFGDSEIRWDVCDLSGKSVANGLQNSVSGDAIFKLGSLPAGMYQLRIISEKGPVVRKISISK
jgi:hypothetical protein